MNKLLITAGLALLPCYAQADYKLSLFDQNGVETSQCIKSYSFSNNLESLARNTVKDVYSASETVTNKIYFDKTVYRRVFSIPATTQHQVSINTGIDLSYVEDIVTIQDLVTDKSIYQFTSNYSQFWRDSSSQNLFYYHNSGSGHSGIKVIIEYTKAGDSANSADAVFKSYLHYVPSASSTEQVVTQDLEQTGVRFLPGYSYNNNNDTCTKD